MAAATKMERRMLERGGRVEKKDTCKLQAQGLDSFFAVLPLIRRISCAAAQ
jgi:hypothetical protein